MVRDQYTPVPSGQGPTLSVREAAEYTKAWMDGQFEPEQRFEPNQKRWLMRQLANQALTETMRTDGDGNDFHDRLVQAYDLLHSTWLVVTPDKLKGWDRRGEPTEEERKAEGAAKRVLWKRRDPLKGYQEGLESPYQTDFSKDDFAHYVADYLARPWMRQPVLDWIFVDAFVTRELSVFGEEVKRQYMPGRRDMLGVFHHRYFDAKGNLAEMMKPDWAGRIRGFSLYIAFAVALPVAGIWAAFAYGWTTTGL